jgi:hypothetical protein
MKRIIVVAMLSLGAAIASPTIAHACSCSRAPARTALATSAAVFSGRVTAVPPDGAKGEMGAGWRLAHFAPDAQWKLPAALGHPDVIPVYVLDLKTSDCGLALTMGQQYLVFAMADSAGRLMTGWCEGTRLYAQSAASVAALGPGHPIGEADRRFVMIAFGGVAAMLLVGLIVARRRPKPWGGR